MKTEKKKKQNQKKKHSLPLSRIAVALVAISLCGVLILWDSGVIDLPFLVRRERREPITEENKTQEEQKPEATDWDAIARIALDTHLSFDAVENSSNLITNAPYDSESMSILKQAISNGEYSTRFGFLIKENGEDSVLFSLPEFKEIEGASDYELSHWRDRNGNAVFQKKGTEEFFRYDRESGSFVPTDFIPARDSLGISVAMPSGYGASDENKTLLYENGLFGYEGTYLDGRRTKKFSVPVQYPTAFSYSEGFAVMADENSKITIRNEKGEAVFDHLSLILPEKKDIEALGFSHFENGLLRVVIAGYDAEGNLISRRESAIDTTGKELSLPEGYQIVSFTEGILLVSDGKHYGYLSAKGAWIADPVYTLASPFFEGLATVENEEGKVGMIDRNGSTVIPCAFDEITPFSDGHALLYTAKSGWYFLSKVDGIFRDASLLPPPTTPTVHTKVTITRGPQNTFDYEPDEIIELKPPESTPKRTTRPENTLAPKTENPEATTTAPSPTTTKQN